MSKDDSNIKDTQAAGMRGDLHRRSLFSVLDRATRQALTSRCKVVDLNAGQTIFMQGARHEFSYIIESGLVSTYYVAESGREVMLGQWSEGDMIGGPFVFGRGVHVWSSVAVRSTRLLAISGDALRELADQHPGIYPWIADIMSFKMLWISILLQVQSTERVQQRLVKLLLMLADIYGRQEAAGIVIRHSITQSSLAALVGASRQWTNKSLSGLRERGLIGNENNHIVLIDEAQLRAMISSDQQL